MRSDAAKPSQLRTYMQQIEGIAPAILDLVDEAEQSLAERFIALDEVAAMNQIKVLRAFQENRINATHFAWNTGYGYDDAGREAVERVYASVFHCEAALVRPNLVNGTHAIATTLLGLLRPGDELLAVTGTPYDTLQTVIEGRGEEGDIGSLRDYGIRYREVPLNAELDADIPAIEAALRPETKIAAIQRSTGYDWRPAISLESIRKVTERIHAIRPDVIVMVDNCYGEFVATEEPTDFGADVIAGSLIKNPGGGLALSGGYICGRRALIEQIAYRLTCPGIGAECGLTFGQNRSVLQGLFLAPRVVHAALRGAYLCASVYRRLGFAVCPSPDLPRSDIVQAVEFRSPEPCIAFCQAIQAASPIDAYVTPIPWRMPGYADEVIMASGSFVQGSSIELSADAPLRAPYIAYFQGGLTYEHARYAITKSVQRLQDKGFLHVES